MVDACIIGAPKCGTSSLFQWLTAHPQISGPEAGKELFFFMDDGHPLAKKPNIHEGSLQAYGALFPDDAERTIEGTTHYLFQRTAREYLGQMDSRPLIVAVLRDPARRVWSSFRYTQNNLARVDSSLSFAQYVELSLSHERERIIDLISHPGSAYVLSRDIEYSKYIKYLIPWREKVGDRRLFVVEFGTLVSDPKKTCCRLASALEIDECFYSKHNFESQNSTYETKSTLLHSWVRRVGQWIPEGKMRQYARQAYMQLATSERSSTTQKDEQVLNRLRNHYRKYNQQLSQEFDVDISTWWP